MKESGLLFRSFPVAKTSTGKTYTNFILKRGSGEEVSCKLWESLPTDLVGEEVSFEATPNEYKGKITYNVKGKISKIGNVEPSAETTTAVAPPPKAVAEPAAPAKQREDYRAEAEKAVEENLKSAQKVADALGIKPTPSNLVELGDMIGRTLTALSLDGKNRRF